MSYYKKVTLKDIANDSGVSVSSVSMILNKREGVSFSNETVEKVLSSAKKLGYEISSSPKKNGTPAYNTQRSAKYIAIFCPNISNSYYSTIAQSIEQAAYQKGFKTLIITTFRDEALEKRVPSGYDQTACQWYCFYYDAPMPTVFRKGC